MQRTFNAMVGSESFWWPPSLSCGVIFVHGKRSSKVPNSWSLLIPSIYWISFFTATKQLPDDRQFHCSTEFFLSRRRHLELRHETLHTKCGRLVVICRRLVILGPAWSMFYSCANYPIGLLSHRQNWQSSCSKNHLMSFEMLRRTGSAARLQQLIEGWWR